MKPAQTQSVSNRANRVAVKTALRALALTILAASVAHANPSGKKWFNLPVPYRVAASVDNTGGTNVRGLSGPTGGPAYATVVAP